MTTDTTIKRVIARKVLNSRGGPAIEVEVTTTGGAVGRSSAPSGASKGRYEAVEFPRGGVDGAVKTVGTLVGPAIKGLDAVDQEAVDEALHEVDGTDNFGRIGGNTAYAVSLAAAKAASIALNVPFYRLHPIGQANEFPFPLGNVLGGGKHALGKTPDIQEFLVLPIGARSFLEAVENAVCVHKTVGKLLSKRVPDFVSGRGDEGAWAVNISNEEALNIAVEACDIVTEETGVTNRMGLDLAASTFWRDEDQSYVYARDGRVRDEGDQIEFVLSLIRKYKLAYVEDPLHEDDFEGFSELTKKVKHCLICGDDLFVTNKKRLEKGAAIGAGNAIIIKPNQVGTLTDAGRTVEFAERSGYVATASHRSGETEDSALAHLALSFGCSLIKTGIVGGERVAKINELIRVEGDMGKKARMARVSYV